MIPSQPSIMEEESEATSYLDYETFLDPTFSPASFANTLILATNDASDSPLDLSTPLSRVLFDVQEVDTHLDKLSSTSALPLLNYTRDNVQVSEKLHKELEAQVEALTGSYERLKKDVIARHEVAEETRLAAIRIWDTLKLGRTVGRCLTLGRQLEADAGVFRSSGTSSVDTKDDGAIVRCSNTILALRQILETSKLGEEAELLDDIEAIKSLRTELVDPTERAVIARSEQIVGQFSMSSLTSQAAESGSSSSVPPSMTYAQSEDTKSRATSALLSLYLLSPVSTGSQDGVFEPSYLVSALQEYLKRAITSSLAGLSSALAALPKLDRTLLEVSARCQNIVALEMLLDSLKPPSHPMLTSRSSDSNSDESKASLREPSNLLQPLLNSLDTASLPSYFWRSMASQLTTRVQRILKDGGVSARTLRSNRDRVRDAIRQCVNKGSTLPAVSFGRGNEADNRVGNWEREAAVMVGSVVNVLGR